MIKMELTDKNFRGPIHTGIRNLHRYRFVLVDSQLPLFFNLVTKIFTKTNENLDRVPGQLPFVLRVDGGQHKADRLQLLGQFGPHGNNLGAGNDQLLCFPSRSPTYFG